MAEKLEMMSSNIIQENIDYIASKFPNALKEVMENGKLVKKIDFNILKQELSTILIDDRQERYQMTWPDKKKSILLANSRINATLRPIKEKSVDFDNTKNLYIEGDNLNVLKLLRETYLNSIKMIYIDPPYNTGNNLIYKNDFSVTASEYATISGDFDEVGNRLVVNSDSYGRFHTDWLNNIYPPLKIARDLLTNDGLIAVAIDDNELYNLKKLMDEVFHEINYVGTIVTRCNPQGRNKNNIDPVHEYHLIYAKNINDMPLLKLKKDNSKNEYSYLLRSGTNSRKHERPNRFYPMLVKDNKVYIITDEEYQNIYVKNNAFDEEYIKILKEKYENLGYKFILPVSKNGEEKVWQRMYLRVKQEYQDYIFENGQIKVPSELERTPTSLWIDEKYSNVAYGANRLKELFKTNKAPFDFSKSIYTVKDLISLNTKDSGIILDFYPGSGTTAEAVFKLNAVDGGNRSFILVQLPELCSENSDGYSLGYKTIPEIAQERIKKAGELIKNEKFEVEKDLDVGFRVLKLDSSNMHDVYYNPNQINQGMLDQLIGNIKEGRTALDLLFQVMLELGIELSAKIEEKELNGKTYFIVNENDIVACFDNGIDDNLTKELAKIKPIYAVFKDSSFTTDSANINCEQIFKSISPSTTIKVI
jgi:adenine-specific DNA-methyltransferase